MRILIVDDEPIGRIMLVQFLKEFGECDQAQNGEEAIDFFEQALDSGKPYDLVCLDIVMPGMNGLETLSAIRKIDQDEGRKRTVVFMISASRSTEDVSTAFFEGDCDDYIAKPFNRNDLCKLLHEYDLVS